MNCPNCGAKTLKKSETGVITFSCFSSTSESWRAPLIRCTEGEKSFKKVIVSWVNENNEAREHTVFDCSFTYAKAWFRETITKGKFVEVREG